MTRGLENALLDILDFSYDRLITQTVNQNIKLRDYILSYTNYITIDTSNLDSVLCPIFCFNSVYERLRLSINANETINNIVTPLDLYFRYRSLEMKTIDSAIKILLKSHTVRLREVRIKGCTYYGNFGLILDEHFNILFMPCIRYNFNEGIKEITILVNRAVLTDNDDIMCKALMKKVLPFLCQHTAVLDFYQWHYEGYVNTLFTSINNMHSSTSITSSPYDILNLEINTLLNSIVDVT